VETGRVNDELLAARWLVGRVLGGVVVIIVLGEQRATLDKTTRRLLLLSISGFIHLDQLPLVGGKLPGKSNVLLKFDSLAVVSAEPRFVVRRKLKICLLYSVEAPLYGLTNLRLGLTPLCLGLVADSRMEKSYMRFFESDMQIDVLCPQEFDAVSL
jgi:hypothetical protein